MNTSELRHANDNVVSINNNPTGVSSEQITMTTYKHKESDESSSEEEYAWNEEYPSLSGTLKLIEQGETMAKSTLETVRRVYDDDRGVYIEVKPDQDYGSQIVVTTSDKKSQEWFGAFLFQMDKEMAENLGKALILTASELP